MGSALFALHRADGFFVGHLLADMAQHSRTCWFDLWSAREVRLVVLLPCRLCAKDDHPVSVYFGGGYLLGTLADRETAGLDSDLCARSILPVHRAGDDQHHQHWGASLS